MKKIIFLFSFVSFLMIQLYNQQQGNALASRPFQPMDVLHAEGIANDTVPKKQSRTTQKNNPAASKHADTTRYGVDKSSTVAGKSGSGSGVGSGGSKSAADTMTLIK